MKTCKILIGLIFLHAILGVCLAAHADDEAGPRRWAEPTTAPVLKESLPEAEYTQQLAAVEARVKPEQITDDTPWAGVLVRAVDPKSQAQALGIKPGDVLVESNGVQIYDRYDWVAHREAGNTAATIWSPLTGRKDVALQPGLMGVDMGYYFHPEVRYLRHLHAREKPDPIIFAAAVSAQDNPALARAAAAHEQKTGTEDRFIYLIDAIAASEEGDFDGAIASGMWEMHTGSDSDKRILAPIMRGAALASFHLSLAANLEKDFPWIKSTEMMNNRTGKVWSIDLIKTIQRCDALKWPGPPSCDDAIALLNPIDRTAELTGKGGGIDREIQTIRRTGHLQFNVPDNHFELFTLAPGGHDVRFSARCRFSPNPISMKSETQPAVIFGAALKGSNVTPISMTLFPDGEVEIVGINIPGFTNRLAGVYAPGQPFDVRFIIVGNRCQIAVGGTRVFYGPILNDQRTRELLLVLEAVDGKGQFNRIKWETAGVQP